MRSRGGPLWSCLRANRTRRDRAERWGLGCRRGLRRSLLWLGGLRSCCVLRLWCGLGLSGDGLRSRDMGRRLGLRRSLLGWGYRCLRW